MRDHIAREEHIFHSYVLYTTKDGELPDIPSRYLGFFFFYFLYIYQYQYHSKMLQTISKVYRLLVRLIQESLGYTFSLHFSSRCFTVYLVSASVFPCHIDIEKHTENDYATIASQQASKSGEISWCFSGEEYIRSRNIPGVEDEPQPIRKRAFFVPGDIGSEQVPLIFSRQLKSEWQPRKNMRRERSRLTVRITGPPTRNCSQVQPTSVHWWSKLVNLIPRRPPNGGKHMIRHIIQRASFTYVATSPQTGTRNNSNATVGNCSKVL